MMSIVLVSVVLAAYALAGISAGTGSVLLFVCRQGESSNPGPTLPRSFGGLPGTGRRALIGSAGIPRSKCRSRISIHESEGSAWGQISCFAPFTVGRGAHLFSIGDARRNRIDDPPHGYQGSDSTGRAAPGDFPELVHCVPNDDHLRFHGPIQTAIRFGLPFVVKEVTSQKGIFQT